MNHSLGFVLIAWALPLMAGAADAPARLSETFAQPALVGIQVAARRARDAGNIQEATATCMMQLKSDSVMPVFDALLAKELTEEEQQAAEVFLKSATGIKFSKYGLLKSYIGLGEPAPEPLPEFTPTEMEELRYFSKTPAGDKLFVKKVLQTPANVAPLSQRIQELLAQCKTR